MPYILKDLVVDRVDLVDEGANSAAFIEERRIRTLWILTKSWSSLSLSMLK